MRRAWPAILCAVVLASVVSPALGQAQIRVVVDGSALPLSPPPRMFGGRVFVPLRGVFERLGALVEWKPVSRTVLVIRHGIYVELRVGEDTVSVNGSPVGAGPPSRVIAGRVFVPLRVISEAIGGRVTWRAADRTVVIASAAALPGDGQVVVSVGAPWFAVGQPIVVSVANGTALRIFAQDSKTDCSIVELERQTGSGWTRIPGCRLERTPLIVELAPGERLTVTLDPKSRHLTADGESGLGPGTYRVRFSFARIRGFLRVEPEAVWSGEFRIR